MLISNPGYDRATAPRLAVERSWVFRPAAGEAFNHHPFIVHHGGRYLAMWSNGRQDEDEAGQRVLCSVSRDGRTWDTPRVLAGPSPGRRHPLVLTACGFHAAGDRLVAYVGHDEYAALEDGRRPFDGRGRHDRGIRALSSADGATWCDAGRLGIPGIFNHAPQRLASGRLLAAGFIAFPWSDDPSGLSGWRMSGFADLAGHQDGPVSPSGYAIKERLGIASGLCEGAWLQADDGEIRMFLRSNTERLWACASRDDGASWSIPSPTGFTDNVSKFHLGRLPDGRHYYVGCPDPEPRWRRNPLVLSLSRDGLRFDRHAIIADEPGEQRFAGMHKVGDYGYPHSQVHDGALHVVVSRCKESIEHLRIPLAEIARL